MANAVNVNGYVSEADNTEDEQDLSLLFGNMLIALKKIGWALVLLTIAGLAVGFVLGKLIYKPEYSTSASFTVAPSRTGDNYYGFYSSLDDQLPITETYVITSSTLKNRIIEKLGKGYADSVITAEALANTNLVTVTVTADTKKKAYAVIDEVISEFPKISQKIYGDVKVSLLDDVEEIKEAANAGAKNKYLIFGGLGGLVIGLAVVFIYSLNLNLVSDAETLQKYVNCECIGKIPQVVISKDKKNTFVTIRNRNVSDDFKEAFQFVRTRTERFFRKNGCTSLLITSTFPGEGKTTTTLNTAISLAQNNKRVMVIDGDLRNPSIIARSGAKARKYGLDDVLRGKAQIEQAVIQYPRTNVYFLSCNNPMSNASEVLSSDAMAEVIKRAKAYADYVIIDSPPTDVMGDAILLSEYADSAIFVVRQNYGKLNNVVYAIESIEQSNSELIGFILNGSDDKIKSIDNYGYGNYSSYKKS